MSRTKTPIALLRTIPARAVSPSAIVATLVITT